MATKPPVNEQMLHDWVAHALDIERLKNTEQRAVIKFIDEQLVPDLMAQLVERMTRIEERGLDLGPATTQRLRELIAGLQQTVERWTSTLSRDLNGKLGDISRLEAEWAVSSMHDNLLSLPVVVETVLPSAFQLAALIETRPVDGVLLQGWIKKLDENTKASIDRAIRVGIASGEATPQIARRVREVTDFTRSSAIGLTRTAVGHAASIGRDKAYEANADILQGVGWAATLDTRTCPRCGPLDGKVFKVGKGPRPLLHVQCRCTTYPVLKSFAQLGIKANDLTNEQRASMDGQVPASLTWPDWLKRRSAAEQDAALGKTRAKLFRSGALEIKDFVNRSNEVITLDALRAKHAAAFERVGF